MNTEPDGPGWGKRNKEGGKNMRQGMMLLVCAALAACGSSSNPNPGNQYTATLTFGQELPVPSVPSTGSGTASLTDNGTSMSYTITVSGLTSAVTVSHIH